ncbi:MAG TPA: cell division protein FtsQ/DivIB [Candidatus Bathyarchaeia archaeon]|nr:cell division protein FtsQ/DivIB [Candidatus Bathyarchaeia archaeon]
MRFWKSRGMVARGASTGPRISLKLLALSAGVVAAAACIVLWSGVFIITDVRFYGTGAIPQDALKRIRDGLIGRNLVTVSCVGARARLEAFPEVQTAVFKRRPMHTIECYIVKREPVALLVAGDILEVDAEGVVIPRRSGAGDVDLPVITGIDQREVGAQTGIRSIGRAVEVLKLFKELGFSPAKQLSEIHIAGDEVDLVWMGTGTLVRLGRDEYAMRVRKLRTVFGILSDREQFPKLIDLRFDRQVVVR